MNPEINLDDGKELRYQVEPLKPSLDKAIRYLRSNGEALQNWRGELGGAPPFEDLLTLNNTLKCLDDKLQRKINGESILDAVAPHTMACAREKIDPKDTLTHETLAGVERLLGRKALHFYWLDGLKAHAEKPESLSRAGGVYTLEMRLDKPTTSNGGAEIQQALAASVLHRAYATTVMGNTRLPEKYDFHKYKDRGKVIKKHQKYLESASKGELPIQKAKHLAHIKAPVTSKQNLFSHNQDLQVVDGSPILRESKSPEKELVRLIRMSEDGRRAYFYDITVEECLSMDPNKLGEILNARSPGTAKLGFAKVWNEFQNGYGLHDIDIPATPYSVSSRVFESKQVPAMQAVESGNYISHIAYDHGKLHLKKSHVPENGASAKLEAFGIAKAVQNERRKGADLAPEMLPMTEVFPSYSRPQLPEMNEIRELEEKLNKARKKKRQASEFEDNEDLVKMLDSLELQNVRLRYPDIAPEQAVGLSTLVSQLNAKYTTPRREALRQFMTENPAPGGKMDEEMFASLCELVAPSIGFQDVVALGISSSSQVNVAVNELPLLISNELAHTATPVVAFDQKGKPDFNTHTWMDKLRTEKSLGKLACNSYNLYKLLTASWRKNTIGAENLGWFFSNKLTDFMMVDLHISTLGTLKRNIDGKTVELDGFETAKPDPDEERANALSFLTLSEDGELTIKARFRDKLTPSLLESLPIDQSEGFDDRLAEVLEDESRGLSKREKQLLESHVEELHSEWMKIGRELGRRKTDDFSPYNSLILAKICKKYHSDLSELDGSSTYKKPLQLLLLAGMRRNRLAQLNAVLNMKI